MKTASTVLGIIGGVICIILAIVCLVAALAINPANQFIQDEFDRWEEDEFPFDEFELTVNGEEVFTEEDFEEYGYDYTNMPRMVWGMARDTLIVFAVLFFIGGILGIIGAAIVRRSHVAAGVLQLIAAFIGFVSFILLLIGGILALASGKEQPPAQQQVYTAVPPPPQAPQ